MYKEFYVYLYRDPTRDNEIFYVGKGKDRRMFSHLRRASKYKQSKTSRHWFLDRINYIRKLGFEPIVEVYCNRLSNDDALLLEKALIKSIGRKDLNTGPLLNLTDGGEKNTGRIYTHEQRLEKSKSSKRAWEELSEQARKAVGENISKALTGRELSSEHRTKAIDAINSGRNKHHQSLKSNPEYRDQVSKSISKALTGRKLSPGHRDKCGLAFKGKKHKKSSNIRRSLSMGGRLFVVVKADTNDIVGEWINQKQCARDLSLDHKHINKCLNGKRKTHRGFIFKFKGVS